jgi:hypothetical protein
MYNSIELRLSSLSSIKRISCRVYLKHTSISIRLPCPPPYPSPLCVKLTSSSAENGKLWVCCRELLHIYSTLYYIYVLYRFPLLTYTIKYIFKQNADTKLRIERVELNAKNLLAENTRDPKYDAPNPFKVHAPVMINGTADIGTPRARLNHPDACMDYYIEEEFLKKKKAPIEMITEY